MTNNRRRTTITPASQRPKLTFWWSLMAVATILVPLLLVVQSFQVTPLSYSSTSTTTRRENNASTNSQLLLGRSSHLRRNSNVGYGRPSLSLLSSSSSDDNDESPAAQEQEQEWYPHDPAWTTPQLLVGIWEQIAQAKDMVRGETQTVIYPQMQDDLNTPKYMNLLFAHLDACRDVCDHFGITTTLVPYKEKNKITGFTVKSFRNPDSKSNINTIHGDNESGELEFGYDPFWDDEETDFDNLYKGVDDQDMVDDPYPKIENRIPDNDEEIVDVTKQWVNAVMSDMGVCPFSQGPDKAGLPIGNVFYQVDRSTGFEDMYVSYWKEVARLEQNNEKEMSTILLITPEFCMDNLELYESFTNTLTQPLTALGIEDLIQLVFFHPTWSFRDGGARMDSTGGQAANYARRSPWPMINLLRTSQVRTAQKGIPTGLVYKQNEKTLNKVGVDKLETMLRLRDWTDSEQYKVNRREFDALKIAQDFQTTGKVSAADTSLHNDATPAAQKVERNQVEQGDLVKVLMQALEKRLGKKDGGDAAVSAAAVTQLSGPETSATAMATDFLVEELEMVIDTNDGSSSGGSAAVLTEKPAPAPAAAATTTESTIAAQEPATTTAKAPAADNVVIQSDSHLPYDQTRGLPDEIARARQERIENARRALMSDLQGDGNANRPPPGAASSGMSDPMQDVLFGKGGISERNEEDENYPEGMNPDSFY